MKKIYNLGDLYVNTDNVATITKPYISENKYKTCTIWINGQEYYRDNYIESYSIICDDETEKEYQEFKQQALELFDAFLRG